MTLSYFAQHELKLYDNDGNERKINPHELQFIKMLDSAFKMHCDLQFVTRRGQTMWVLKLREETSLTPIKEKQLRGFISAHGKHNHELWQSIINETNNNDTSRNTGSNTAGQGGNKIR